MLIDQTGAALMLLGELKVGFPWGVLLVTDEQSADQIPDWSSDEEQVTHCATAAVARVIHEDEGDVIVQVWDEWEGERRGLAFSGVLEIGSGVLRISDALGEVALRIPVGVGRTSVEIYTDSSVEATHVDLVVTRES